MEYTDKERLDWLLYESEIFMVDGVDVGSGESLKTRLAVTLNENRIDKLLKPRHIDDDLREVIDKAMSF